MRRPTPESFAGLLFKLEQRSTLAGPMLGCYPKAAAETNRCTGGKYPYGHDPDR